MRTSCRPAELYERYPIVDTRLRVTVMHALSRSSYPATEAIRGECRCRARQFGLRGLRGLERVDREIIRPLDAWDMDDLYTTVLQPGAIVSRCRILSNRAPGAEPYVVEFEFDGRRYFCPLFSFQPRTQTLAAAVAGKVGQTIAFCGLSFVAEGEAG